MSSAIDLINVEWQTVPALLLFRTEKDIAGAMHAGITRWTKQSIGLMALFCLASCVWTPHDIQLNPTAETAASNVGHGTSVFFRFIDDRDDLTVGHRGVGAVGAKVSATDLPGVFEARLRDVLQKKQFELVDTEQAANAKVTYRLRSFKFDLEQGFWTGGSNAAAALAVDADRAGRTYATVYRYNNETRVMAVPGGDEIDSKMNAAMNQLLQQAGDDEKLAQFLVGQ